MCEGIFVEPLYVFVGGFTQSNIFDCLLLDSSFLGNLAVPLGILWEFLSQLVCLAVGFGASKSVISGCMGWGTMELEKCAILCHMCVCLLCLK